MPSLAARVLAAALDVLTEGQFPRLWSATAAGSVSGDRPGRALDPDAEETLEVIGLLDAAQRSYTSKERVTIERARGACIFVKCERMRDEIVTMKLSLVSVIRRSLDWAKSTLP